MFDPPQNLLPDRFLDLLRREYTRASDSLAKDHLQKQKEIREKYASRGFSQPPGMMLLELQNNNKYFFTQRVSIFADLLVKTCKNNGIPFTDDVKSWAIKELKEIALGAKNGFVQSVKEIYSSHRAPDSAKDAINRELDSTSEIDFLRDAERIVLNAADQEALNGKKYTSPEKDVAEPSKPPYVDLSRLTELQTLKSDQFDLTRLIRLCEELNVAHANECVMSIAMLARAIVDHVPPIFGMQSFTQVANNYSGSKSFKSSMQRLDQSLRNVADLHLHTQIRARETLPTFTQVDFRADIDVLLSEIVRLLK